jgi:cytochrome b pre-mRNA-processing protein 3
MNGNACLGGRDVSIPQRRFDSMAFPRLLRRDTAGETAAERLYDAAVAQARTPAFYRSYGVPDTLDGRFEMIGLHVFLLMRRLKSEGETGRALSQALCDRFFDDLDRSLREMGAGDLGVGRRVKAMAKAFYGRIAAYDVSFAGAALEDALARNLYGTVSPMPEHLSGMARYLRDQARHLAMQKCGALAFGTVS